MVWLAEKPSLRDASCCSVEVVKGGCGLRATALLSIDATVKSAPSIAATARLAAASSPRSIFSSFCPSSRWSRAVKASPEAERRATSTLQYSSGRKTSISASRSQIRRSATDCTRPADRLPGSLRQSTGDRVKPTR